MQITLQQQAEIYLGTDIEPSEWDKAKEDAEHKLKWVIEREGDGDGARREPWYMSQLIAEAVRANRFTQITLELATLYRHADKQMGIKKGQPTS